MILAAVLNAKLAHEATMSKRKQSLLPVSCPGMTAVDGDMYSGVSVPI